MRDPNRAREVLNRRLREGISDMTLAELVIGLADDGRLFLDHTPAGCPLGVAPGAQPRLNCSISLFPRTERSSPLPDIPGISM